MQESKQPSRAWGKKARALAFWLLLAVAFGPPVARCMAPKPMAEFSLTKETKATSQDAGTEPLYREQLLPEVPNGPMNHCSTLTELPDHNLLAVWYAGSREGQPDVALYSSTFDRATAQWGPLCRVTDRLQTQREVHRYVKKVGNPTLFTDSHGTTWLYYVSVSMGGWSGSAVNVKTTTDGGRTWTPARRLVLNPFMNIGTLVRTIAVPRVDGTVALPTYQEFLVESPELVELSPEGEVLGKTRMAHNKTSLQPSVVPTSPTDALALLRNVRGGIKEVDTHTAGEHWTSPVVVGLNAPASSIMATRLFDSRLLLVFNNHPKEREKLSLAISSDAGRKWQVVYEIPEDKGRYAYPFVLQASDGMIHLTYSWKTNRIKHVMFNLAWLREKS